MIHGGLHISCELGFYSRERLYSSGNGIYNTHQEKKWNFESNIFLENKLMFIQQQEKRNLEINIVGKYC